MKCFIIIITFLFFPLFFFHLHGQQEIDEYIEKFTEGDLDDKVDVFSELFNSLDRSYPDSAFYFIHILQNDALKEDREDALAHSNYYFANFLINKSLFEEANAKLDLALSYFEYDENDTILAEVYNTYGNIQFLQGNYNEAEENYLKSIVHGKKSDQPKFAYFGRINLARTYIQLDRKEEAIQTLEEVLDFYTAKNDARQIASAYGLLGQIAMDENDLSKAIEYYERSLEYNLTEGSNLMIANGYTNMAIASFYKEEHEKAEQYFLLALSYREKTGNHFFISESYHNLGSYYLGVNESDKAILNFQKALEIADQGGIKSAKADAFEGLAEVYESIEDFKNQAKYLKNKIAIEKEIFKHKNNLELNLLRISFQNERDQIEADQARREKILESRVDGIYKTWEIWIWALVISVFLVGGVLFYKSRANKMV